MLSDVAQKVAIFAKNNTQATGHPFWSTLGGYLDSSQTILPEESDFSTCDDEDTSPDCYKAIVCDKTRRFADMGALESAQSSIDSTCIPYYALGVLDEQLHAGMAAYDAANSGYDEVFDDYEEYTREVIADMMGPFMKPGDPQDRQGGPGNKYFDCEYRNSDKYLHEPLVQQCPIVFGDEEHMWDQFILTYTLRDSNGFYDELANKFGIQKDWVEFPERTDQRPGSCPPGGPPNSPGGACISIDRSWIKKPEINMSKVVVTNPKVVFTDSRPKMERLEKEIFARRMDLSTNSWLGTTDDIL